MEVAVELLAAHTPGAPVVDERGEFIGFVSEFDILRVLEAKKDLNQLTAEDVMAKEQISVTNETSIDEAVKIMEEKRFLSLPVKSEWQGGPFDHATRFAAGLDRPWNGHRNQYGIVSQRYPHGKYRMTPIRLSRLCESIFEIARTSARIESAQPGEEIKVFVHPEHEPPADPLGAKGTRKARTRHVVHCRDHNGRWQAAALGMGIPAPQARIPTLSAPSRDANDGARAAAWGLCSLFYGGKICQMLGRSQPYELAGLGAEGDIIAPLMPGAVVG